MLIREQLKRKYSVHCTCGIRYNMNNDGGGRCVSRILMVYACVCCRASSEV